VIDLNSYLTPQSLALIARFRHEPEAPDWPSHVYLRWLEEADCMLYECLVHTDEDGNVWWR
jgi:hypothetical protein